MPKKVSETQKKEIASSFAAGKSIKEISAIHNFSIITITKQLKRILGNDEFERIKSRYFKKEKSEDSFSYLEHKTKLEKNKSQSSHEIQDFKFNYVGDYPEESLFEVIPICSEIDFDKRKDLTSEPIEDIDLPKIVYMIVDKKTELQFKCLRDYPRWQFLDENELNRKAIEIFDDLKIAKSFCNKEQKVIKVPNTNVFKIVAPLLLSRGISRIVTPNKLIAL